MSPLGFCPLGSGWQLRLGHHIYIPARKGLARAGLLPLRNLLRVPHNTSTETPLCRAGCVATPSTSGGWKFSLYFRWLCAQRNIGDSFTSKKGEWILGGNGSCVTRPCPLFCSRSRHTALLYWRAFLPRLETWNLEMPSSFPKMPQRVGETGCEPRSVAGRELLCSPGSCCQEQMARFSGHGCEATQTGTCVHQANLL